jgi:class 3 adenylate cyclase/YHS domain-containing protein
VESTFLFADLAGFTALTEAHGDERAADMAAEFCDVARVLLSSHHAEEVKTIGDAVMVMCREPAAGVELGVRILEDVEAKEGFPVVRVGMNTGPAIERGGDWFGAAVNIAARVSGAAGGGEVLLTEATRAAASELDGIELHRHGELRLKNVKRPVAVYRAMRVGAIIDSVPIDPVCRMAISENQAAGALTFEGREYRFCSLKCAAEFASDPEHYADAD